MTEREITVGETIHGHMDERGSFVPCTAFCNHPRYGPGFYVMQAAPTALVVRQSGDPDLPPEWLRKAAGPTPLHDLIKKPATYRSFGELRDAIESDVDEEC